MQQRRPILHADWKDTGCKARSLEDLLGQKTAGRSRGIHQVRNVGDMVEAEQVAGLVSGNIADGPADAIGRRKRQGKGLGEIVRENDAVVAAVAISLIDGLGHAELGL